MSKLIKLTIQIGDKEIEMTKADAKELYHTLGEMFEVKTKTEYVPAYRSWDYWPRPYYGLCANNVSLLAATGLNANAIKDDALASYTSSSGKFSLKASLE